MSAIGGRGRVATLVREVLLNGTLAGLAMMPFGAAFRSAGLRINEYGPKTLALLVGDLDLPWAGVAGFAQHMVISWGAALPFSLAAPRSTERFASLWWGAAYGAAFYVAVNSLALPLFFGDPTPWALGAAVVLPSFVVHLVYGAVLGALLRSPASGTSPR